MGSKFFAKTPGSAVKPTGTNLTARAINAGGSAAGRDSGAAMKNINAAQEMFAKHSAFQRSKGTAAYAPGPKKT